jgi:hypothetical protein
VNVALLTPIYRVMLRAILALIGCNLAECNPLS